MAKPISEHEGSKYLRRIHSAVDHTQHVQVDVYCVLKAFNVVCPARQQAIKKLLCAGIRGKGDELADLVGAEAAVCRAIELAKQGTVQDGHWTCLDCNNRIKDIRVTGSEKLNENCPMYCDVCQGTVWARPC